MFCLVEESRSSWMDGPLRQLLHFPYPIPILLVIYNDGKVQQRLNKGGQMIYDWGFRASGKQVAFCTGTTHGDSGGPL